MQSNPLIRATLGITWALCGLGTLLVGIRLFFVALRKSPPTWDFFWILVSTALSIACQVLIMLSVQRGAGQHLDQTPLDEIMPIVSIFFKMCSIGVATACTAKLAVVALFMRMERPSASKFWPWLMYSMAVGVVMAGIVQIGMVEVSREQIKTIADLLNSADKGLLDKTFEFAYFFGGLSGLIDLSLTIYPMILVYSQPRSKGTRIAATVLITLGIIPIVAAVLRTVALHNMIEASDVTYNAAKVLIAFSAEYGSTVVLVSLVPLEPVLLELWRGYPATPKAAQGPALLNRDDGNGYEMTSHEKPANVKESFSHDAVSVSEV